MAVVSISHEKQSVSSGSIAGWRRRSLQAQKDGKEGEPQNAALSRGIPITNAVNTSSDRYILYQPADPIGDSECWYRNTELWNLVAAFECGEKTHYTQRI